MHPHECKTNTKAFRTSVLHSKGSVELEDLERLTCGTQYTVRRGPPQQLLMQKPPNIVCLGDSVANGRKKLVGRQQQIATSIRCPQQVAELEVHLSLVAA